MVFAAGLFTPQIMQAQGTLTYLSNLGQPSAGSQGVASNSWMAVGFETGNNVGGYDLNSVQLTMTDASGVPSGFTVMLYSQLAILGHSIPRTNLDTLNGSTDPSIAGIYTYTDGSNFILSPSTFYYIVLAAGTATNNGAYQWSYANTSTYSSIDGWVAGTPGGYEVSANGLTWGGSSSPFPQYAINATPTPEPSSSWLFLLCSGIFIYVRRTFRFQ